jgi:hypothetical protein
MAPYQQRRKVKDDDDIESARISVRGFTTAAVFDISQTDGNELLEVRPLLLDGADTTGLWDGLSAQVDATGYVVEGDCYGANGYTDHKRRAVRVRTDVSDAQAAKTLCHELTHVLLHPDEAEYFRCRGRAEVEAESVAYLVCQLIGLATGSYSWPYIAHWSDGKSEVVQETAARVVQTAWNIFNT